MPDYPSPAARDIWGEEIERVVKHGINANRFSTFARYCPVETAIRSMSAKGEVPKAAMLSGSASSA